MTHWLILLLYNIVSLIAVPIIALIRRFKKNESGRLFTRLKHSNNLLWFHSASVGEINAVKPLIARCIERLPYHDIHITTMTTTGNRTASGIKGISQATLFPFDFLPALIYRIIVLRPKALVIVETEMWPNLLLAAKWFNIPVIVVNGRLTMKSVKPFRRMSFLWKPLWEGIRCVCAQSEADTARYLELGFDRVVNAGNLKFAIKLPTVDINRVRKEWGFSDDHFVLAFGSSRPGEEKLIADAYRALRGNYPNLRLVIAPRHLNRLREAMEAFTGLNVARLSERRHADILMIDSMGILNRAYAISDISLVGGSFHDFGGHNPLEPAFYSKPILMGPYHSSCKDTVRILMENQAIRIVPANQLTTVLDQLISSNIQRNQMGINARMTLEKNSQGLERNFEAIETVLYAK